MHIQSGGCQLNGTCVKTINESDWLFVNQPPITEGVTVLITAAYRTGSTFYGEIFNRNPDFMHFFEPFAYLRNSSYYPTPADASNMLNAMYTCTFNRTEIASRLWTVWKVILFCGIGDANIERCPRSLRKWGEKDSRGWMTQHANACREAKHYAVKVIRLRAVQDIEDLIRRGLKVIVLLRDPRGMTASRYTSPDKYLLRRSDVILAAEAADYCNMALDNLRYIRSLHRSYPAQIHKSFYFGRYEDLAADPVGNLHDIYNFIGIRPSDELINWFQENQISKNVTKRDIIDANEHRIHLFDTHRDNPALASQAWRTRLSFTRAQAVQKSCAKYLDIFGYRNFTNIIEYKGLELSNLRKGISSLDLIFNELYENMLKL